MADVTYQTAVALARALINDVRALIAQVMTLKSSVDTTAATIAANTATVSSALTAVQTTQTQIQNTVSSTKVADLDASTLSTSVPAGSKKLYVDASGFLRITP